MIRKIATFMMVAVCSVPLLRAQNKQPCSLLTTADISAVGASGQGIPMGDRMCSWRMKDGGLHLDVKTLPPGTSRNSILAMVDKSGQLREQRDFGNVTCFRLAPPAGESSSNTHCFTASSS